MPHPCMGHWVLAWVAEGLVPTLHHRAECCWKSVKSMGHWWLCEHIERLALMPQHCMDCCWKLENSQVGMQAEGFALRLDKLMPKTASGQGVVPAGHFHLQCHDYSWEVATMQQPQRPCCAGVRSPLRHLGDCRSSRLGLMMLQSLGLLQLMATGVR